MLKTKLILSLLVALGALVFSIFTAEMVLRVFYGDNFSSYKEWGHKKSVIFGFEAKPHHRWSAKGAVYTTDESGFRTHLPNPLWREKTDKTQRVFVLGGSSAFGYGLNDDQTWPHKLEAELERRLPASPFLIINSANNGHNSLQALLRFYLGFCL